MRTIRCQVPNARSSFIIFILHTRTQMFTTRIDVNVTFSLNLQAEHKCYFCVSLHIINNLQSKNHVRSIMTHFLKHNSWGDLKIWNISVLHIIYTIKKTKTTKTYCYLNILQSWQNVQISAKLQFYTVITL